MLQPREPQVHYPESDGQPMAETDLHRDLMADLIVALQQHYRSVPDVYVSGNLFVYFENGNPRMVVAPDVFVVRGVEKRKRRIYQVWNEPRAPERVIELSSRSTHIEDLGRKRAIYASFGVLEYYLFDPDFDPEFVSDDAPGEPFFRGLRGFRLEGGELLAVEPTVTDDGVAVLPSAVTGLELHARDRSLRWFDPQVRELLPIPAELHGRVAEELARANEERARADAAEAELARLREEIGRLKKDAGS